MSAMVTSSGRTLASACEQRGQPGVKRLFLLGRPSGAEVDLHDDDSVRALNAQVRRVVDQPARPVLGDDLEAIALGNIEDFHHGAMHGAADGGNLRVGAPGDQIDANERHGRILPNRPAGRKPADPQRRRGGPIRLRKSEPSLPDSVT